MREKIRRFLRRVEDFLFVLSLTQIQIWRKMSSYSLRKKEEEERRRRERFEATRDHTASF